MNADAKWSLTFRYIAAVLLFAALIAFLVYAGEAVRAFAIAGFVAYLINPAVEYLSTRRHISRKASVNYVFFSALILLVAVPATLAPIFYDEAQIVLKDLLDLSNQVRQVLSNPVRFGGFIFHFEEWAASLFQLQNAFLAPLPEDALQILETTSVQVLWFLVILVSIHFFLSQWPNMRDGMISIAPPSYRPELHELYRRIRRVWMAYLRGQIVLMLIVGVVFTIAWTAMGIPGALVLGVIAGLFTLIPDVGPFLAAALATAVALLEGSTWIPLSNFWIAGITVAVYLVLIGMKNFFLRPVVMGRSVHMNEALVFIIIVIATILEGILGALLIVPLYASTVVVLRYVQRKILAQPPFDDDGSSQFVMPEEMANSSGRKWGRRATDRVEESPVPGASLAGEAAPMTEQPASQWNRRATDRKEDAPVDSAGTLPSTAEPPGQAGPASGSGDPSETSSMPLQKKEQS